MHSSKYKIISFFSVSKRMLLFIAFAVWAFAGSMLFYKAIQMIDTNDEYLWLKISLSALGGIAFFFFLFHKISGKHVRRILDLPGEKHFFLSFFNIKSYIMMASMIGLGVLLRKTAIVPPTYLFILYFTMGTPLLLSSFRFFKSAISFKKQQ